MFCPKCGTLLMPKKQENKRILHCSCGYNSKDLEQAKLKEVVRDDGPAVAVIDKDVETLPLTEVACPVCKHPRAYFWMIQTRASDEPETKFLRCEKCRHTWRDYT